jgi:hypothetical protein
MTAVQTRPMTEADVAQAASVAAAALETQG